MPESQFTVPESQSGESRRGYIKSGSRLRVEIMSSIDAAHLVLAIVTGISLIKMDFEATLVVGIIYHVIPANYKMLALFLCEVFYMADAVHYVKNQFTSCVQ